MDVPDDETGVKVDYTIPYFIYGFLALLGICILFSFGKAVYHYFKVKAELNNETTAENTVIENHSITREPSASDRQTENSLSDSDRLPAQLDKLRRLLNRLNAMGTFSRDTIGDLSAQSISRVNNSTTASSALWSSIDFDDLEESTINEGNFQKTPTEKSVSPSISDFSIDTSGILCDNLRQKHIPTSSSGEYALKASAALSRQSNPSDAINQILEILDAIMIKNKIIARPFENNTYNVQKSFDDTVSSCESISSDTLISTTPVHKVSELLKTETKLLDDVLMSKQRTFDLTTKQYECKIPSSVSTETKTSNRIINITSNTEPKSLYTKKFSTSSKSLDGTKFSVSRSVSICIDPITCLSTQTKGISESYIQSTTSKESRLKENDVPEKISEKSFIKIDLGDTNTSDSISNLLERKLLSADSLKSSPYVKVFEIPSFVIENEAQTTNTDPETDPNSQNYFLINKTVTDTESIKYKALKVSSKSLSSIYSSGLHVSSPLLAMTFKLSASESELKQTQFLGSLSPDFFSDSDAFLSPVISDCRSPSDKIDWKSPAEPISSICDPQNFTPSNGNMLPINACIWLTPPNPED